jgi:hypothetical protein
MLSDDGLDAAVQGLAAAATLMSLHSADPGTDGADELSGGAPVYSRQPVTWSLADPGVRNLTDPAVFDVPAGSTVTHYGTWSDDGLFQGGDALRNMNGDPVIETFGGQGTYTVTSAVLTITDATAP